MWVAFSFKKRRSLRFRLLEKRHGFACLKSCLCFMYPFLKASGGLALGRLRPRAPRGGTGEFREKPGFWRKRGLGPDAPERLQGAGAGLPLDWEWSVPQSIRTRF